MKKRRIFLILILLIFSSGYSCSSNTNSITDNNKANHNSIQYLNEIEKESLIEEGFDENIIKEMLKFIDNKNNSSLLIDGILLMKNDKILLERYYNGRNASTKHNIYSCTKSITSALIGIAIDKGYINSINDKVIDFFPEYSFDNLNEMKKELTIKHLLTMTAGFDYHESGGTDGNFGEMLQTMDWVKYMLDRPIIHKPGTIFNYNTGNSHILSAIITKTTGMSALSFGLKYLFEPIGIFEKDINWPIDPNGINVGGAWIRMTERSMSKFGLLYLKNGKFNNTQIISPEWIEESKKPHINVYKDICSYGYQWWIDDTMDVEIYFALGAHGQYIVIIEDFNIVVAITCDLIDEYSFKIPFGELIKNFILKSLK